MPLPHRLFFRRGFFAAIVICCAFAMRGVSAETITPLVNEGFESPAQSKAAWTFEGSASVETGDAFEAASSLVLRKNTATLRDKVSARSPAFRVQHGALEISCALKSDLVSMDNSYNGTLSIAFTDSAGKTSVTELASVFRETPWKKHATTLRVPDEAVSARLLATINKETTGLFAIDDITVKAVAGPPDDGLRRMMFTLAQVGHLIYPEDPRTAEIEVWSLKELPAPLRELTLVVRDYWGAEQHAPVRARLAADGKVVGRDLLKYTARIDLADIPLRVGRYYELHGEITRPNAEPFSHNTSFAILPEAAANAYPSSEIPFSSRTWDQRFPESPLLTRRLGMRICNTWGSMNPAAQKELDEQIGRITRLDLAVLCNTPAHFIEQRNKGWKKLLENDGAELRQRVRWFMNRFVDKKPLYVVLGNEPHNKGDEVKIDVTAYRIIYQELKAIDPSVFVIGTSVGLEEDYFKAGFGEWLDAYNFHSYEDPDSVRDILENRYPAMFRKYGFKKPVWSTEIGMNSQGMTRQAVAALLYKKFASFFAGGGGNVSWFGLFYPDPDAKMHHSFASAHNVFDCRYSKYAPKLDAIAYYNAVNGIANKRFVSDKSYTDGSRLFHFRNDRNQSLLIAYRDQGRADVRLPLAGATNIRVTRIDGSLDELAPSNHGVLLTLGEDPVLVAFDQGPSELPASLDASSVRFVSLPAALKRDEANIIETIVEDGVSREDVSLIAPHAWTVTRLPASAVDAPGRLRFSVQAPAETKVLAADLALHVRKKDNATSGLLSAQIPVTGLLEMKVLPIAYDEPSGPGLKLVVRNNSAAPQALAWSASLTGQQALVRGKFSSISTAKAKLAGPSSGDLALAGGDLVEVLVPFADTDPTTVYHTKVSLRDSAGRTLSQERPVGGFVGVPKAVTAPKIDGILDEDVWSRAPVQHLDRADQFWSTKRTGQPPRPWGGLDDLSARIRYAWDDAFLYVAVVAKDNVAGPAIHADAALWRMDGLQFLIDPVRPDVRKPGKYEYSVGRGAKGVQAWCTLSADARSATGSAPEIVAAIRTDKEGTGDVTYEVAIPWARLAPFVPGAGANLGFTLIVNDDDGPGRDAFMTWFGNAHLKDVDTVGDLILQP